MAALNRLSGQVKTEETRTDKTSSLKEVMESGQRRCRVKPVKVAALFGGADLSRGLELQVAGGGRRGLGVPVPAVHLPGEKQPVGSQPCAHHRAEGLVGVDHAALLRTTPRLRCTVNAHTDAVTFLHSLYGAQSYQLPSKTRQQSTCAGETAERSFTHDHVHRRSMSLQVC